MAEYRLDTSLARETWETFDAFTQAYLEAAMWTLTDSYRECQVCDYTTHGDEDCANCGPAGDMRERTESCDHLGLHDIAPTALESARQDCARFQRDCEYLLKHAGTDEQNGHDFWLTRNRHGAGYWDRGYHERIGGQLSDTCEAYGQVDWYVGDDKLVYQS